MAKNTFRDETNRIVAAAGQRSDGIALARDNLGRTGDRFTHQEGAV
jgi:hypothetical protein